MIGDGAGTIMPSRAACRDRCECAARRREDHGAARLRECRANSVAIPLAGTFDETVIAKIDANVGYARLSTAAQRFDPVVDVRPNALKFTTRRIAMEAASPCLAQPLC